MHIYVIVFLTVVYAMETSAQICSVTRRLPQEQRRGMNILEPTEPEDVLCDSNISGYYRIYDCNLAMTRPLAGTCGTKSPIYTIDFPPTTMGETVEQTLCYSVTNETVGQCITPFRINVTYCGSYCVYDFTNANCVDYGKSAYCFHSFTTGAFDPEPTLPPPSTIAPPIIPTDCEPAEPANIRPPWLTSVGQDGFCDRKDGMCTSPLVKVTPRTPLPIPGIVTNISCCFQEIWVDSSGPVITTQAPTFHLGLYESCDSVRCFTPPFPASSTLSVPGYLVSVSINNGPYGTAKVYLPYDSRCVQCTYDDQFKCVPVCTWNSDTCFIDGKCILPNMLKPSNPCELCNPGVSNTDWSPNERSCIIQGTCFIEGDHKPGDFCQVCNPNVSRSQFTPASGCYIGSQCYPHGSSHPDYGCLKCDAIAATFTPAQGACFVNNVCYSNGAPIGPSFCTVCNSVQNPTGVSASPGTCYIGGLCYLDGQPLDFINFCQKCVSARNQYQFTVADGCLLSGQCYASGAQHPFSTCLSCNTFIFPPDFTVFQGCFVNNVCYNEGAPDPNDPCSTCNSLMSRTSFTPQTTGVCQIDGGCYQYEQANPNNYCEVCRSTNPTAWTMRSIQTTQQAVTCDVACQSIANSITQLESLCQLAGPFMPSVYNFTCYLQPVNLYQDLKPCPITISDAGRTAIYNFCLGWYTDVSVDDTLANPTVCPN